MKYNKQDNIKVFLCDDHTLFRQGVRKLLGVEKNVEVIGEASNGVEMLELLRKSKPDVVLMDISMPKMDGVTTTYKIKKILPRTQIIILTVYEDEDYIFDAIKAGAMGYLLKDVDADDLVGAIRKVYKGEALIQPIIATKVLKEFASFEKKGMKRKDRSCNDLTGREKEVLRLIVLGGSNKAIARKLGISEKTVKNHVSKIFQTLQVNNRTEAAIYALNKKL